VSTPEGETPQHIPYKVTAQGESQTFNGQGLTAVWETTFEAPNGVTGTVKLPMNGLTAAAVDAAIEEQLDTIMSIHELGPEPHPENLAE
jgi:hypothetical protein